MAFCWCVAKKEGDFTLLNIVSEIGRTARRCGLAMHDVLSFKKTKKNYLSVTITS